MAAAKLIRIKLYAIWLGAVALRLIGLDLVRYLNTREIVEGDWVRTEIISGPHLRVERRRAT